MQDNNAYCHWNHSRVTVLTHENVSKHSLGMNPWEGCDAFASPKYVAVVASRQGWR